MNATTNRHLLVAQGHAALDLDVTTHDDTHVVADTLCGLTGQPVELDLHGDPCLAELDLDAITCPTCLARMVEHGEPDVHTQLRDYLLALEAGTLDEDDNAQECLADWVERVHGLSWQSADWSVEWDGPTPVGVRVITGGLAIRYVLSPTPTVSHTGQAWGPATPHTHKPPHGVYITRDRHVILCPECLTQDEVVLNDDPTGTQFVCGDCGCEFDRTDAVLCLPDSYTLRSRGHDIPGPYTWVVVE